MASRLSEHGLFLREFWRNFHTTGAVLPSGRRLAAALARYVGKGDLPQRILEVGPGTGAITRHIVRAMGPEDQIDLVELNPSFANRLRDDFAHEPELAAVAPRVRVLQTAIESLPQHDRYNVIVSGLPLNNFSVAVVETILQAFRELLTPGGTLSFFEYMAVRRLRMLAGSRAERDRARGIQRVLGGLLTNHEIRRDAIWLNVPPAWAHHARFDLGCPARGGQV
ncbi:MAG: methyltransferase domain-containing protein [Pirellulales bacterium]|nr:methyltransferase domain-containing protein [Pirellulales bacterium]